MLVPLFVVMFAALYLITSRSNPAAFDTSMSRTQALYFTVVVLSTVGFGDITPETDPARLLTTIQIVCDLLLIGVVIRLILRIASDRHTGRTVTLTARNWRSAFVKPLLIGQSGAYRWGLSGAHGLPVEP